ncbi:hypothetical protein FLONG3_6671 [Fusarium longipes]|uniref:Uncharacterized protein n=1 Tax=Fusarium longipes TaxID=694270 RepID=A0A395SJN7_9HYPO|nr:hypothetical protein FLONG3_6671 [Fusarium longipes]
MVVEKGNRIFIPADQLTTTEIRIKWSQSWCSRSEQYYSVPFFNRDKGNEEGVIFVQKNYIESLRSKQGYGDDLTVVVDDSFQYGQNKERTKRWLAYHDKNNWPYQWRFVEGLKSKLGSAALQFANGFFPSIDLSILKSLFGDYLRDF